MCSFNWCNLICSRHRRSLFQTLLHTWTLTRMYCNPLLTRMHNLQWNFDQSALIFFLNARLKCHLRFCSVMYDVNGENDKTAKAMIISLVFIVPFACRNYGPIAYPYRKQQNTIDKKSRQPRRKRAFSSPVTSTTKLHHEVLHPDPTWDSVCWAQLLWVNVCIEQHSPKGITCDDKNIEFNTTNI